MKVWQPAQSLVYSSPTFRLAPTQGHLRLRPETAPNEICPAIGCLTDRNEIPLVQHGTTNNER